MSRRVVSLNGTWDLVFDPKNRGRREGWWKRFPPRPHRAPVPGVWERVQPGYDGVGWYRTRFARPAVPAGGRVQLRFHALQYYGEVWLNGERLGDHEGGWTPFSFEIGRRLRDENELIVRVVNPPSDRPLEGFRVGAPLNQSDLPVGKAAWYFNFGGLWQGVDLLVTGPSRIEEVFVQPRLRERRADVACRLAAGGAGTTVSWTVFEKDAPERKIDGGCLDIRRRGLAEGQFPVHFGEDLRTWSPEAPRLYVLRMIATGADGTSDTLDTRFGMREFTIRAGQFLLNGVPIRLKGLLQQGVYPRTLAAPENMDMARREWALFKQNGFNFMRAHLRPAEPAYLDLADELGVLVEAEPPIGWIIRAPRTEARCRRAIEEMIRRDRNHPSIVFWCLLNEAYHFLGFTMPQIKRMTARLATAARRYDPTRLMMDTSGGAGTSDGGGSDIWLPYSDRKVPMVDAHAYCPIPPTDEGLRAYRLMGRRGRLTYISEYGALEMPPDYPAVERRYTPRERAIGLEDYRLHADFHASLRTQFNRAGVRNVFGSVSGFIRALQQERAHDLADITAAIWSNPRIAGMAYCQLADASGEQFGVTDIWRRPKPALAAMANACADLLAAPHIEPRVFFAQRPAHVFCRLWAGRSPGVGRRWRCVLIGPAGERVLGEGLVGGPRESGFVLAGLRLRLPAGAYVLAGRILHQGRLEHEQRFRFRVLPPVEYTVRDIAAYDPTGDVAALLRGSGVRITPFTNNTRTPDRPIVMDLRQGIRNRALLFEIMGQARKTAQIGGTLVLLEPEMLRLRDVLLPRPPGGVPMMRATTYVRPHPVMGNMPRGVVAGYEYAEVLPNNWDSAEEVRQLDGETIIGSFGAHMWTRPACYFWGAALYRLPLGRGQVWVCQLPLLGQRSDMARSLLYGLIEEAQRNIRPADPARLFSRCIDPL